MASLFTKIISGELPSYKIAENEFAFAFLDINPVAKGHTLVVPKTEVDIIFDLDDKNYKELHLFAKRTAIALKKVVSCQRISVSVVGLEIPHAHIHLIPINTMKDFQFQEKIKMEEEAFIKLANQIKNNFI